MGRPPKIPNLLPPHQETIYFVTICVERRCSVLANDLAWFACLDTLHSLDRWHIHAFLLMPDHIHGLISPYDRELPISLFSKWFKIGMTKRSLSQWTWQEGCFDRLLRNDESASEKWEYIRHNPVRAGLVQHPEQWPYQIGLKLL